MRAKKMRQDGGAEFISTSLKPQASAISSMESSVACRSRLDWCRQNTVDAMGVQRLPLHRVLPRREDVDKLYPTIMRDLIACDPKNAV